MSVLKHNSQTLMDLEPMMESPSKKKESRLRENAEIDIITVVICILGQKS